MVEKLFDRRTELKRLSGVARPRAQDYFMDAMSMAPMFLGMPPLPMKGGRLSRLPKKASEVAKPTGKSIAKELNISYMTEADGLNYFNVPVIHKGKTVQSTIASPKLTMEAVLERVKRTRKAFAASEKERIK